jgi:hypothetical protein
MPQGRLLLHHELRHVEQQRAAIPVSAPELDSPHSTHEHAAHRLLDPRVEPVPVQRGLAAGTSGYIDLVRSSLLGSRAEIDYVLGQFFTEQRALVFP